MLQGTADSVLASSPSVDIGKAAYADKWTNKYELFSPVQQEVQEGNLLTERRICHSDIAITEDCSHLLSEYVS